MMSLWRIFLWRLSFDVFTVTFFCNDVPVFQCFLLKLCGLFLWSFILWIFFYDLLYVVTFILRHFLWHFFISWILFCAIFTSYLLVTFSVIFSATVWTTFRLRLSLTFSCVLCDLSCDWISTRILLWLFSKLSGIICIIYFVWLLVVSCKFVFLWRFACEIGFLWLYDDIHVDFLWYYSLFFFCDISWASFEMSFRMIF